MRNLRWVPGGMLYAGADALVHPTSAVALQQAMAATEYPYTWWMHPAAEHTTLGTLDDWRKESVHSAPWTLQASPPRVTYRFDPSLDEPEYGLVHDHAYWVSRLRTAGAGAGEVDLTSQGCGGSLQLTRPTIGEGTDPVPWVSQGAAVIGSTPLFQGKRLTGTMADVASANVDVDATCLRNDGISYDITTDAPTSIRFSDGRTLQLASAGRHGGQIK